MNHTEKKIFSKIIANLKTPVSILLKGFMKDAKKYSYLQIVPASKNSEPRIVDSWIVDPFEEITILLVLVG